MPVNLQLFREGQLLKITGAKAISLDQSPENEISSVLVVEDVNSLRDGDAVLRDITGGNAVPVDDDAAIVTDVDVVIIAESVQSSKIGKWADVSVGMVVFEGLGYDDLGLLPQPQYTTGTQLDVAGEHPITEGLSGTITIAPSDIQLASVDASSVTPILTLPNNPSRAVVWEINKGESIMSGTATARRIGIGTDTNGTSLLNTTGREIVRNAIIRAAEPPAAIVNNLSVSIGDGKLLVSWEHPVGETIWKEYRIYINNIFSHSLIGLNTTTQPATSYEITGLTNGQSYTIAVAPVDYDNIEHDRAIVVGTPQAASSAIFTSEMNYDHFLLVRGKYMNGETLTNPVTNTPDFVAYMKTRSANYNGGTWVGPQTLDNGRVKNKEPDNLPPLSQAADMMWCARRYALSGEATYGNKAKNALLDQISKPRLDFNDSTLYPLSPIFLTSVQPSITFGIWGKDLFRAWDYLEAGIDEHGNISLSTAQRDSLRNWFYYYANFWLRAVSEWVSLLWAGDNGARGGPGSDRWNRTYNLTSFGNTLTSSDRYGYRDSTGLGSRDGSNNTIMYRRFHRSQDNQQAKHLTNALIIGKLIQDGYIPPAGTRNWSLSDLQRSVLLWTEEALKYTWWPDESNSELHRGISSRPNRGWTYLAEIIQAMVEVTDGLARLGDTSFRDISVTEGLYGSNDPAGMTVYRALKAFIRYAQQTNSNPTWPVTGARKRYGTVNEGDVGNNAYLINHRNGSDFWVGHIMAAAAAHLLYQDADLVKTYKGTLTGLDGYPTSGQLASQQNQWGWYLLAYGDMEGRVIHPAI